MNEQNNYNEEMIMKAKIEKREKIDTIIAYCLIVILLGSIIILTFLKLNKKEETKPNEYVPVYITLEDIVNELNNSNLELTSTTSNNAIIVTTKDNKLNLNIPLINNELEIIYNKDNEEEVTKIYKNITSNICNFYNKDLEKCTSVVNNITKESNISGIRFLNEGDNTKVYINILSSIDTSSYKEELTEETIKEITTTNYNLTINDVNITNIILTEDTSLTLAANIKNNKEEKYNITIKLYDENNNVLSEETKEYTNETTMEIKFTYNDNLVKENIKKYSINITR